MIRAQTSLTVRDEKQIILSGFKGFDFSSSPLDASKYRAIEGKNFIFEGINHKRPGWKQIAAFGTANINGIYKYDSTNFIVYAGTTFYTMTLTTTGIGYTTATIDTTGIVTGNLVDQEIEFYKQNDKIYIVGAGDLLVWHSIGTPAAWTLERVYNNDITYTPTTSISIDYSGFENSLEAVLERPNLMNSWRKNTLRGKVGSYAESPTFTELTYQLDSTDLEIDSATETPVAYVDIEYLDDTTLATINLFAYYITVDDNCELRTSYASATVYGMLYPDGTLTLDMNTEPPTASDNITVTFEVAAEATSANINGAKFGTLFGVDGVTSQLFVAGYGTTLANYDFFSYPLDFTYWPDNNYRAVGNSAITGYSRLGDGTLVIFKEKSNKEAAIFVRTGTLTTSETTGYLDAVISYTSKAGYPGSYLSSRKSIENLAGDPIYLTEQGLHGIMLSANVSTDERFARRRSRYIDTKLKTYDLTTAAGIVFDNRYYLSVGGDCFIADARFRTQEDEDMDDTYNYEWWFWDNIAARVWAESTDSLYFGTADGRVCVFDTEFTDRAFETISSGDVSIHPADDEIVYDSELEITDGEEIKFSSTILHEVVFQLSDCTIDGNTLTIDVDSTTDTWQNIYFLDNERELVLVGDDETSPVTVYIDNVELGALTFDLVDADGVAIDIDSVVTTQMYLLDPLDGTTLYVANVDTDNYTFQLRRYEAGGVISILLYNDTAIDDTTNTDVAAVKIVASNVVATWYPPYLDLTTFQYLKTLTGITIVSEPNLTGIISFGYYTRIDNLDIETPGGRSFDFTDFDFTDFTFDVAFATSYTQRIKVKNVNYVLLKFESDTNNDCSINAISLRYKINNLNRGVR